MKKFFLTITVVLCFTSSFAQSEWEVPGQTNTPVEQSKKEKAKKIKKVSETKLKKQKKVIALDAEVSAKDRPYLKSNSVPIINGNVVFTLDIDVPGKNAQEIYNKVYSFLDNLTKEENQIDSRIALINKKEHIIAGKYKEWLVFSDQFLSLDRSEMDYTIIANCTDGHLKATLERIYYFYQEGRSDELKISAEKWISDEYCVNRKHTKLLRSSGKFRRKTIDRKNVLFEELKNVVNN
jgi:hypothetical protein